MSTTIDLTEQQIAELRELTQQTDTAEAIRVAMTEYLRYVRRLRLKELSGKVQMQENRRELENSELKANKDDTGPRAD